MAGMRVLSSLRCPRGNRPATPVHIMTIVAIFLAAADPAAAETMRLDARELFARAVTQNLRLSDDDGAIELERGELFEDDGPAAGYSYKPNEEKLSATTWIKKVFLIPNPQARKATLLVG